MSKRETGGRRKMPLFEDTSPEAEAVLLDLLRQAPGWRKLQMVEELNRNTRMLLLAGLRYRYPNANETELKRRLADLILGPELAAEVYGPLVSIDAPGLRVSDQKFIHER
jgi:hypothetical protein